jgi:hypothetical protein
MYGTHVYKCAFQPLAVTRLYVLRVAAVKTWSGRKGEKEMQLLINRPFAISLHQNSNPRRQLRLQTGLLLLAGAALVLSMATLNAQRQKRTPITTRWAKNVDTTNPLPEYPRPQMVRKDWMNLNGTWQFQSGFANEPIPSGTLRSHVVVPFPVESVLSGIMMHFERLWYRRSFSLPEAWAGKQVILHFGGVDYETEVFVNGKSIGTHKGGYDPFSFNITPYLVSGGPQDLVVRVYDPTDIGGQPRGKQSTNPEGIMYTPTTGIWRTVWLEPVDKVSIRDLKLVPDVDGNQLRLTVNTTESNPDATIHVVVKDVDKVVKSFEGKPNSEMSVPIPEPKLWSPESPFLYGLDVSISAGGTVTDQVSSYFGMRKISIGKVGEYNRILLNNQPVFELGPLDQGFWPDGIYTAPTDEALRSDIETMKAMGFNMVRKHEKVEPARWYYWADKLGLLVWQDMPSPNSYLDRAEAIPPIDKQEFESELQRLVETHWNNPSIIMWVIFNEGQGQFDTQRLTGMVKSLDPSRLVNEASGGNITGAGDINDLHRYPEPSVRAPTPNQALANGEFGGVGYHVQGHSWDPNGFGYTTVSNPDDLLYLYAEYLNKVKDLRDNKGLSAAVYTELTDVMIEINGLMTYDRIPKVDLAKIAQANHFILTMPTYTVVVPTSEQADQNWKLTTTKPAEDWAMPGFVDAQWTEAKGGFGVGNDHAGTSWTSSDIWMRRHFNPGAITAASLANLVVRDMHVGDVEVFINGVLAYTQRGQSTAWEYRSISSDARASVKANADNVLSVHCTKRAENQFIDAGLNVRVSADN